MKTKTVAWIAAPGLFGVILAGCIVDRTWSTIYVEADDSATLRVLRDYVRSDEREIGSRAKEEQQFLLELNGNDRPFDREMESYRPLDQTWQLLRERRPFTVLYTARYSSLEQLAGWLFAKDSKRVTVSIERTDGQRRLSVTFDEELSSSIVEDAKKGATPMLDIVLADGCFVSASGFQLSDDRAIATLRIAEPAPGGQIALELAWHTGACDSEEEVFEPETDVDVDVGVDQGASGEDGTVG